jgi:uncharacterized protein YkwD
MELIQALQSTNWVDWAILAIVIIFIFDGWQAGFVALASGFIAYLAAFWVALQLYKPVGYFLVTRLGLNPKWQDVIGLFSIIFFTQIFISQILVYVLKRFVRRFLPNQIDAILGASFSLVNTTISIALVLLLIVALPVPSVVKNPVQTSPVSQMLLKAVDTYARPLKETVEQTAKEAVKFLTIHPKSNELIRLDINPQSWDLVEDEMSERAMLNLVNNERIKRGIVALSLDKQLVVVARKHSRDMFIRKYFSHISPDGLTLKERLEEYDIQYQTAAENLAYAPTVETAHTGLMESEGHRKNILDPTLTDIGIGIIDGGVYGKMFTQVFTNRPFLFEGARQ